MLYGKYVGKGKEGNMNRKREKYRGHIFMAVPAFLLFAIFFCIRS